MLGDNAHNRAKPRLSLVGNLGDEVSTTRNMGSVVIWRGREGMVFVFRMPMIDMVRCAARQHTLQVDTISKVGDRLVWVRRSLSSTDSQKHYGKV